MFLIFFLGCLIGYFWCIYSDYNWAYLYTVFDFSLVFSGVTAIASLSMAYFVFQQIKFSVKSHKELLFNQKKLYEHQKMLHIKKLEVEMKIPVLNKLHLNLMILSKYSNRSYDLDEKFEDCHKHMIEISNVISIIQNQEIGDLLARVLKLIVDLIKISKNQHGNFSASDLNGLSKDMNRLLTLVSSETIKIMDFNEIKRS